MQLACSSTQSVLFIQALTAFKGKSGNENKLGCPEEKVAGVILGYVKWNESPVPVSEDDGKSLSVDVESQLPSFSN